MGVGERRIEGTHKAQSDREKNVKKAWGAMT